MYFINCLGKGLKLGTSQQKKWREVSTARYPFSDTGNHFSATFIQKLDSAFFFHNFPKPLVISNKIWLLSHIWAQFLSRSFTFATFGSKNLQKMQWNGSLYLNGHSKTGREIMFEVVYYFVGVTGAGWKMCAASFLEQTSILCKCKCWKIKSVNDTNMEDSK